MSREIQHLKKPRLNESSEEKKSQRNNSNSCAFLKSTQKSDRRKDSRVGKKNSQRQERRQMRSIKLLYESQKFYIITK